MARSAAWPKLPGTLATAFAILFTSLWTFWGVAELFYEGWGLPFPQILVYLIPGAGCLALTLLAVAWPTAGGALLLLAGIGFTVFMSSIAAGRGYLSWDWALTVFPMSGLAVLVGALFLLEGRRLRRLRREPPSTTPPPTSWVRRHGRLLIAAAIPLLSALGTALWSLPPILRRVDDGDRSARLIESGGVRLVWAPTGPGWNWKQPFGGYPSWDSLALYGLPPAGLDLDAKPLRAGRHATQADMDATGLCRYLGADGADLLPEPQDIWRLPTTAELVASLVSRGQPAGCAWDRATGDVTCREPPNKDTPLWAPDEEAIYYWSSEEKSPDNAYYVGYTGVQVHDQPKDWGNPRHGYRCVRDSAGAFPAFP